jgi:hypothetical protein
MPNQNNNQKTKLFQQFQQLKKYEEYNYPVILLDSDLDIIYKNTAARFTARFSKIKFKIGTNIKKYINPENIEKLYDTFNSKTINTVNLNLFSDTNQCVVQFDYIEQCREKTPVAVLKFFNSLAYLKDGEHDIISKINNIITVKTKGNAGISYESNKSSKSDKNIIRLWEHFKRNIYNLEFPLNSSAKSYCDIGMFMHTFDEGISLYIKSLGYKTDFAAEDKMFIYRLNKSDFAAVNLILVPLAFEYSVLGRIAIKFWTHSCKGRNPIGILRYEVMVSKDFVQTNNDMLISNYHKSIGSIEYLDLFIAALIAENNGLRLNVRFSVDNGNRVYMDLIFDSKYQPD